MVASPVACFDASMYFKYGELRRVGVKAANCFDAVVSGERTSTTRFDSDGFAQYARWQRLKIGDVVRVWSGAWQGSAYGGRSCLIEVTAAPRLVQLRTLDRDEWSRAEGWAPDFLDVLIGQNHVAGVQVRFRLLAPPEAAPSAQMELF